MIANTILGFFYSYSITGPKNLILIVKAPMVGLGLSVEYMGLP